MGTISLMTCFQNQCAPEGLPGSSVSRLIATRMGQKTWVETSWSVILDWRTYWARRCMHAWWASSMTP